MVLGGGGGGDGRGYSKSLHPSGGEELAERLLQTGERDEAD